MVEALPCPYKKTAILCGRAFEVSKTTIISKHAFLTLRIMYTSKLWSGRLYINTITLLSFSALYSHLSCERFARINSDVALTRPSTDNGFSLIKDQGRRLLSCPSQSQLSSKSSKELSSSHSFKKSHLFWCQPVLGNHYSIISSCDLRAWLSPSSDHHQIDTEGPPLMLTIIIMIIQRIDHHHHQTIIKWFQKRAVNSWPMISNSKCSTGK